MTAQCNAHGLSRDIPDPIARTIRQQCGFGCVICGCAIYTYHHYDPPFAEATEHDPERIALLCPRCHGYVEKGIWSNAKVSGHHRNPKCKELSFSLGAFDLGDDQPDLILGWLIIRQPAVILEMFGRPLLWVEPPEVPAGPFRLSGHFFDESGKPILSIGKNEWKSYTRNWDVEVVGPRIICRVSSRHLALVLCSNPPKGLAVERLRMFYEQGSITVEADQGQVTVTSPDGSRISLAGGVISNPRVGISVERSGIAVGRA